MRSTLNENLCGVPLSRYLVETPMLAWSHPEIQLLIARRGWRRLSTRERIHGVYSFCRNDIPFGFNMDGDSADAPAVLLERVGNGTTKTTLLMTLLRGLGIPCRVQATLVDRALFHGAVGSALYRVLPRKLLHAWAEVHFGNQWVGLEGVAIDDAYLRGVQALFPERQGLFFGYGIAVGNLRNPSIEWRGSHTFIQSHAVVRNLGVHAAPDDVLALLVRPRRAVLGRAYRRLIHPLVNAAFDRLRLDDPPQQEAPAHPAAPPRQVQRKEPALRPRPAAKKKKAKGANGPAPVKPPPLPRRLPVRPPPLPQTTVAEPAAAGYPEARTPRRRSSGSGKGA